MRRETKNQFKRRMGTITVPEGFVTGFRDHDKFGYEDLVFVLTKPDDCELEFRHERGDGTTTFKTKQGERTFDRTGVESSFYHQPLFGGTEQIDLNAVVKQQLDRIAERRKFYDSAIQVPGIPFYVAPEKVEELKGTLKRHGYLDFTPSGFGTGYRLHVKAPRQRFGVTRAKKEMETFFGFAPIWVTTLDCD